MEHMRLQVPGGTSPTKPTPMERFEWLDHKYLWVSVVYWFFFIGSLPFFSTYWDDPSHGGFFTHIAQTAVAYTLLTGANYLTKLFPNTRLFLVIAYGAFGYLLTFSIGGVVGATIVGAILAFFSVKRQWGTVFLTGALTGYWVTLLLVSSVEYNPFGKLGNGFISFIGETFGAFFNAFSGSVHQLAMTWLFFIPLAVGYLFTYLWQEDKETSSKAKPKPTTQTTPPKEAPVKPIVIKEKVQPVAHTNESPKEETVATPPNKRRGKTEKPSKGFFNIQAPTAKFKWQQWWENKIRRLSK